jgi:asparagine N-glycosylation enzyme membrane subunit Stt3
MKSLFSRFAMFPGRLNVMDDNDQSSDARSPLAPSVIVASVACFACIALAFLIAKPAAGLLKVWWTGVLVWTLFPILVTFAILQHGHMRREQAGMARIFSLLLRSVAIFCAVLLFMGIALAMVSLIPVLMKHPGDH